MAIYEETLNFKSGANVMTSEIDMAKAVTKFNLKTVCKNDKTSITKHILIQRARSLDKKHDFQKGDIVKWKQGLKNRNFPDYGEPILVREILENTSSPSNKDNSFAYEQRNIVIGVFDEDEDYFEFYVDSRRLEPFDD